MTTGDLSTLLVWGAATAFTIALVAYSVDLARIVEHAQKRVPEDALATAGSSAWRPATAVGGSEDQRAPGRSARAEGIARSTTLVGLVMLFAGIVLRGVAAGRWPTANMYEFTIVGTFVAVLVLTIVQRRRVIAFVGVLVMGMAVLALVLALNVFYIQADQVQPALQSYWLILHVGVAITATGIFTVAFAASVLQVLKS